MAEKVKTCFVIMPISDGNPYEVGHFSRVYKHLIQPACAAAGIQVIRADDVKSTNYIAIDILQKVVKSDLVICDLSGRNPNVLYELGVRQAFDLPVVLIKDIRTDRIFDIQGMRTLDYDDSLRIDTVQRDVNSLQQTITSTLQLQPHEVNSLVGWLGINKAVLPERVDLSAESSLLLNGLRELSNRILNLERTVIPAATKVSLRKPTVQHRLPNGELADVGDEIFVDDGEVKVGIGTLTSASKDSVVVMTTSGARLKLEPGDPRFDSATTIPF